MKKKTSTMMILFVLVVVILSIIFTWKALETSGTDAKTTAEDKSSIQNAPDEGKIGINLVQPKQEEGVETS